MRVINVVVIKNGVVDSIDSFGVFEEQLSQDVVDVAEKLFKEEVVEQSDACNLDEFEDNYGDIEDRVEDGYFSFLNGSVCLTWSDI